MIGSMTKGARREYIFIVWFRVPVFIVWVEDAYNFEFGAQISNF